jgi:lipopolysaccharide export system permease protein
MRILDRYILKSVLSIFSLCLLTFLCLYIIIDIFSYLEDILKLHVNIHTLIRYYSMYLPVIFVQVAPFCCLLATLYTFAKLNRDNEIIAMRASGLNIIGITKTVIVFGFIISMVVFWVSDRLVPSALVLNQRIKYQMESKPKKGQEKEKEIITNLSMYGMKNRLFFVNKFSPGINTMEGIIVLEQDEHQNITRKIVANKGVYTNNCWVFYQSITYDFDINGQVKNEPRYSDEEIMLIPEGPDEFLAQRQSPEIMTISQLNDYLWKLSKSGAINVVKRLKVDLYQRYTAPLLSLIIILLGIPFSLKMRKRATGISSLGISIILAFLYYVLNAVSIALGKGEVLMPFLAASLSHIIALSFSLYMIFTLP